MPDTIKAAKQARELFQTQCHGVLSTHSVDLPGYPFGSLTPFCLDQKGQAIILISSIAQHTRNISANNSVSLLAYDPRAQDIQATDRITYIGNAVAVNDTEVAERYYHFYPAARSFEKTHDFQFYVIELLRVRYIGGFGEIYWVEADKFLHRNPFNFAEETGMIEHMNNDHLDAIQHYCRLFGIAVAKGETAVLVGIDGEGFHLRCGRQLHRITFEQPIHTALEARQALVELAKKPA